MNLPVPVVGQEAGPQYATDINNCMSLIDSHTHASGSGVLITPNAMNINADLSMSNNNLTNINSARFAALGSPIVATPPDVDCLYVSGVDLYYNDGNGNQVRITQGGGVTSGNGSISGLVPPASASYNGGTGTFIWQQDANIAANMDGGTYLLRNSSVSSNAISITAPNSLPADYDVIFPSTLPTVQSYLTIDSSGNLATPTPFNKPSGSTVGIGGFAVSGSCGTFPFTGPAAVPNHSVTLTTTGRPVMVGVIPLHDAGDSYMQLSAAINVELIINNNSTGSEVGRWLMGAAVGINFPTMWTSIDLGPNGTPGTYNYSTNVGISSGSATFLNAILFAYEI